MIQEHFLSLHRNDKCPYEIQDSAQIEPTDPKDPDELYRMKRYRPNGRDETFDVVFYPDRAEVQDTDTSILMRSISSVDSAKDLFKKLETALS